MMAVPMVRLTDPSPEARYRCGRCKQEKTLKEGYRLLYRGTRRPIRCRECEAAMANPTMARYYAKRFEQMSASKSVYHHKVAPIVRARSKAWVEAHQEENREYKQGYYRLHVEELNAASAARYARRKAEIAEQSRQKYAATHRTPEILAARAKAKAERAAERRATWRDSVCRAVGIDYDLSPGVVRRPPRRFDYGREARMIALYLCHILHRERDRHPVAEIAAEYALSAQGVRQIVSVMIRRVADKQNPDGQELARNAIRIMATLGYEKRHGTYRRRRGT